MAIRYPEYPHDNRLENVNPSQYRMLYDASQVLVPMGQSTTNPLRPEKVVLNTRLYSDINLGYFNRPIVDFVNANVETKRFDKFELQIWREHRQIDSDLPYDDPTIDYNKDLGLTSIIVNLSQTIFLNTTDVGRIEGEAYEIRLPFEFLSGTTWKTPDIYFNKPGLSSLYGTFFLACNATPTIISTSLENFDTGLYLQVDNLPIILYIKEIHVKVGNTKLELYNKNTNFIPDIDNTELLILGGM